MVDRSVISWRPSGHDREFRRAVAHTVHGDTDPIGRAPRQPVVIRRIRSPLSARYGRASTAKPDLTAVIVESEFAARDRSPLTSHPRRSTAPDVRLRIASRQLRHRTSWGLRDEAGLTRAWKPAIAAKRCCRDHSLLPISASTHQSFDASDSTASCYSSRAAVHPG